VRDRHHKAPKHSIAGGAVRFIGLPSHRLPSHTDINATVTATGASLEGFLYHVLQPTPPHSFAGYYPSPTPSTLKFVYSVYMVSNAVGLNEQSSALNKIQVYPNPASDKIVISTGIDQNVSINVKIYNLIGQQIAEYKNLSLNNSADVQVSGLPNGLYMVELSDGKIKTTKKVIVSH
jgi:hypothetical protein